MLSYPDPHPSMGGKAGGEDGRGLTANLVKTVGRCGRVRQGDVESSWPQCVVAVAVMVGRTSSVPIFVS